MRLTILGHMANLVASFQEQHRQATADHYKSAINSFRRFLRGADLPLAAISSSLMERYQAWLRCNGVTSNTTGYYMRILRASYLRAVDTGHVADRRPFRNVYCGVDKTVKRAIPLPCLRKIRALDLSASPAHDYARNIFLLSFCLRGISFVDMCFLKKTDLRDGYLTYRRRKTGKQLTVRWTREMQHILDKYPPNPTDYLLPIITDPAADPIRVYHTKANNINRNLKKIGAKIGLDTPLTLYAARHSWASVARAQGIPVSVISEGMGHDSERTTQIYLASLDTSVIDRANAAILRSLA